MKRMIRIIPLVLALASAGVSPLSAGNAILIKNATIVPVTDPPMESACLLIENGKIARIGRDLSAPQGAEVIDAAGRFVYPGLVAVMTAVGVTGYPGAGNDTDETGTSTPQMDPYDAVNTEDDCIDVTRIAGVTTVQTVSGTRSVINGTSVVLNLDGLLRDEMVIRRNVAQIINMGARNQGKYPSTLPGVVAFLEEKFDSARVYAEEKARAGKKPSGEKSKNVPAAPFKRNLEMEALVDVVSGKTPVFFLTYDEVTLRNALRLIDEYELKAVIQARDGILKYADRLAEKKIPVIWAGTTAIPPRWKPFDYNYHLAAVLEEKGLAFAFDPGGWGPGNRNVRNLPVPAAISVAHGLSEQAALEAMTIHPARMLGVDDMVGSIEVGKTANLAIWSGSPLQLRSRVFQVIIEGRIIPMTSIQTKLRDRFDKIVKERIRKK